MKKPTIVVLTDRVTGEPLYLHYGAPVTWTYRREHATIFPSRAEAERAVFGEGVRYEDAEVKV